MASDHVSEANDSTFDAEVMNSSVPVLVDFWATWCAPCKAIAPALDKLATEKGGAFKVVKVDVQRNMRTASRFGVTNVPTFLVVKGGEVVGKQVGVAGGENGIKRLVEPHL